MESYAGYRGTSPPNLFVSFNRDELDMDAASQTPYQDPLDLKNTFVSWEYAFDNNMKTMGHLTLINPGVQIEDKLFSWYAAANSRGWTTLSRAYSDEELIDLTSSFADFYVRWGYQSSPDHAVSDTRNLDSDKTSAMSHIHKFRLLDMSYTISDKGDKLVTLKLMNRWDLAYSNKAFTVKERLFEFALVDDKGVMRNPAIIIQEVLLQLMSAMEGYKGYSKWTDDQFAALNADFTATLNLKMKEKVDATKLKLPSNAADLYVKYYEANATDAKSQKNWVILDTIREWFGQFGIVPSFKSTFDGTQPDPGPQQTSPNQGTAAPDQGTPASLNPEAVKDAQTQVLPAGEFTEQIAVYDTGGSLTDNNPYAMTMNAGRPIAMDGLVPYILVFKDKAGIAKTQLTYEQISEMESKGARHSGVFYAVHHSFKTQVQDKPWETASKFLAWTVKEPEGLVAYDFTTLSPWSFKKALYDIKIALLAKKQASIDALNAASQVDDTQQQQTADLAALNGTDPAANPPGTATPSLLPESHTVKFVSDNLDGDLKQLVAHLNDKYFKATSKYLQVGQLEFINVPKANRVKIEQVLGKGFDGMSWEKDEGMLLMTNSNHFSEVFEFAVSAGDIKSFPIQSNSKPNTISIATGFNSRPDNIVTSLKWSIDMGSMFLTLRHSPFLVQKVYNVGMRFEDKEYRDVVMQTLALSIRYDNNTDKGVLVEGGSGQGGLAAPELKNQLDVVGAVVFPDAVVEAAQAQAVTMTSTSSASQDQADASEVAKQALLSEVREDLKFISDQNLNDIFFPGVGANDQESIKTRYTVITPPGLPGVDAVKVVPYFRYVTKSPLTILQKALASQGLDSTPENSALLQGKVQSLNVFQKLLTNVKVEMLGVPEMDIWTNEIQNRAVALWVHEPRVPGTYHWLTGMYNIFDFRHKINAQGYVTTMTLIAKLPNTADEMAKYTYLQVGGGT